jgi:hypothetical protein
MRKYNKENDKKNQGKHPKTHTHIICNHAFAPLVNSAAENFLQDLNTQRTLSFDGIVKVSTATCSMHNMSRLLLNWLKNYYFETYKL